MGFDSVQHCVFITSTSILIASISVSSVVSFWYCMYLFFVTTRAFFCLHYRCLMSNNKDDSGKFYSFYYIEKVSLDIHLSNNCVQDMFKVTVFCSLLLRVQGYYILLPSFVFCSAQMVMCFIRIFILHSRIR